MTRAASAEVIRPIIGLEVHVQLRTRSKLFCGCAVRFGAEPNSCVCPVCLGYPGTLPVLNEAALQLALRAGVALGGKVPRQTHWDRKSYFYPDLPKGYQISQYDRPLCSGGEFAFDCEGRRHTVHLRRAHLEEDAGKSMHQPDGTTLVDLNRAGTPLLEIVTEPGLHSPAEAFAFCTQLQRFMVYLGVTEGVMQRGQLRFEPNVNVEIAGPAGPVRTPIVEIKNLNSFKAVRDAIAYEIDRQVAQWRRDPAYVQGVAPNENRGWQDEPGPGRTVFQRSKEQVADYRYFPDPDLPPVAISEAWLAEVRSALPEPPLARRTRWQAEAGLEPADADVLLETCARADLFDAAVAAGAAPGPAAKQLINLWLPLLDEGGGAEASPELAACVGELVQLLAAGTIGSSSAGSLVKAWLARPAAGDDDRPTLAELAEELGLLQVRDAAAVQAWVDQALAAHPDAVATVRTKPRKAAAALGFLRGQVLRLSGGRADPKLVGRLLEQRLGGPGDEPGPANNRPAVDE